MPVPVSNSIIDVSEHVSSEIYQQCNQSNPMLSFVTLLHKSPGE